MSFNVIFLPKADADVLDHAAWYAARDPAGAAQWRIGMFTAVVTNLEADPHRYPEADEAADLGIDLRELVHGRGRRVYRVLFTVDDPTQTVHIHRVRHAAQDRLAPGDI